MFVHRCQASGWQRRTCSALQLVPSAHPGPLGPAAAGRCPHPCWLGPDRSQQLAHEARPVAVAAARSTRAGFGHNHDFEEAGRVQQLQGQVFELKQRVVEADMKRQAAEKATAELLHRQRRLQRRLTLTGGLLIATALLLLLAVAILTWAALEAPPLGTMAIDASGGVLGGVAAAVRHAAAYVQHTLSWAASASAF